MHYLFKKVPYEEPAVTPEKSTIYNGRIVALGGGTGLSTVLKGLHLLCFPGTDIRLKDVQRERLTAVVTVSDDGGSSGKLRKAYPILPPGDIRNCLVALSGSNPLQQALFDFRFNGKVGKHSLGNLILTALAEIEHDFTRAVEKASEILGVRGRVLPATTDNVAIQAEFFDGSSICGESRISSQQRRIKRVSLVPPAVKTLPQVEEAIAGADMIIIGPGSLYTSLIPILLVPGIADSLIKSRARIILVMNLMTEPGETDGYTAVDIIEAVNRHIPGLPIHTLLVNSGRISSRQARKYAAKGASHIPVDHHKINDLGCNLALRDLCTTSGKIRHDPEKLARALLALAP